MKRFPRAGGPWPASRRPDVARLFTAAFQGRAVTPHWSSWRQAARRGNRQREDVRISGLGGGPGSTGWSWTAASRAPAKRAAPLAEGTIAGPTRISRYQGEAVPTVMGPVSALRSSCCKTGRGGRDREVVGPRRPVGGSGTAGTTGSPARRLPAIMGTHFPRHSVCRAPISQRIAHRPGSTLASSPVSNFCVAVQLQVGERPRDSSEDAQREPFGFARTALAFSACAMVETRRSSAVTTSSTRRLMAGAVLDAL